MIQQLTSGAPWVAITTMNNRALLIQPAAVQRLVILDDDADDAVYHRGLWQCYVGGIKDAHGSPKLQAEVRSVIDSHRLDGRALHDLLRVTHLRHRDRTTTALRLDARASWGMFASVEADIALPSVLLLACWGEGMVYYSTAGSSCSGGHAAAPDAQGRGRRSSRGSE